MANDQNGRARQALAAPLQRVSRRFWARMRNWAHRRVTARELEGLSRNEFERLLADMGVARSDFACLAHGRPIPPQLFDRMIRRLDLEYALSTAPPELMISLAAKCRGCRAALECVDWLEGKPAEDSLPRFCPNLEMFLDLARRKALGAK